MNYQDLNNYNQNDLNEVSLITMDKFKAYFNFPCLGNLPNIIIDYKEDPVEHTYRPQLEKILKDIEDKIKNDTKYSDDIKNRIKDLIKYIRKSISETEFDYSKDGESYIAKWTSYVDDIIHSIIRDMKVDEFRLMLITEYYIPKVSILLGKFFTPNIVKLYDKNIDAVALRANNYDKNDIIFSILSHEVFHYCHYLVYKSLRKDDEWNTITKPLPTLKKKVVKESLAQYYQIIIGKEYSKLYSTGLLNYSNEIELGLNPYDFPNDPYVGALGIKKRTIEEYQDEMRYEIIFHMVKESSGNHVYSWKNQFDSIKNRM